MPDPVVAPQPTQPTPVVPTAPAPVAAPTVAPAQAPAPAAPVAAPQPAPAPYAVTDPRMVQLETELATAKAQQAALQQQISDAEAATLREKEDYKALAEQREGELNALRAQHAENIRTQTVGTAVELAVIKAGVDPVHAKAVAASVPRDGITVSEAGNVNGIDAAIANHKATTGDLYSRLAPPAPPADPTPVADPTPAPSPADPQAYMQALFPATAPVAVPPTATTPPAAPSTPQSVADMSGADYANLKRSYVRGLRGGGNRRSRRRAAQ